MAIDESNGEIESRQTTTNSIADEDMVKSLLKDLREKIGKFFGEGAYDKKILFVSTALLLPSELPSPANGIRLLPITHSVSLLPQ